MKKSLSMKILGIIGGTLFIGFSVLGLATLWLSMNSSQNQQIRSSRNSAEIIKQVVGDFMMRTDNAGLARYISQLRGKADVIDLRIYGKEGKQSGTGTGPDPRVMETFRSGKLSMVKGRDANGARTLTMVIPLQNEQRCRECHTESGHVGAILLSTSLEQGYRDTRLMMIIMCVLGGSCFILILGVMYAFFRVSIIRNLLEISAKVQTLSHAEGDLTAVLNVRTEDEIGRLGSDINHLIAKLREIVTLLYEQAGHIAISTCRTMGGIDNLVANIAEQRELAASVAVASEEMAATINDVASTTVRASELSRQVDSAAHEGQNVVADTADSMDQIKSGVENTISLMTHLEASSGRIGDIVGMIEDVADQTNLLALNAAIEAARAGEAGRGFTVVANEVKVLSGKTSVSTREIAGIIKSIQADIREVMNSIVEEKERVEKGIVNSGQASTRIASILDLASDSAAMINTIASATEEQSSTTNEISSKIHLVSETAAHTQSSMEQVSRTFHEMSLTAEQIYATVGRFNVGNYHNSVKELAMELRDKVAETLEKAVADRRISMEALFSTDYQPIPNTYPQKFSTPFDKLFDEIISPIQEEILARDNKLLFAICVDRTSGYVPSHNLAYRKPLTGDRKADMLNNRTKRKFNDHTGLRCGSSTEQFLLQTYARDTGEFLNDLSAPITICGKHWGGVRLGYRAD